MKQILHVTLTIISVSVAVAQLPDWQCQTVDTLSDKLSRIQPMINVTQPLIVILVDFPDGRIQPGNAIPTVDADTIHFPGDSIDAVGGMGWIKTGPNPSDPFRKKIRKYVYDDYWDMIFSAGVYAGNVHPDFDHQGFDPDGPNTGEDPWDLTVYGSLYDYWNEVSNHNLQVQAYPTRTGGSGKYYSGIVNKIDVAGGRNYVRWIMMPLPKRFYGAVSIIDAALSEVDRLHYSVPESDPDYIEFRIRDYPTNGKIAVIAAGGFLGGVAPYENAYSATEKTHGFRNTRPGAVLNGIQENVHEFGHTIGYPHFVGGSYEMMHWGGLGHRRHYWCPPHLNPLLKILSGWIPESNVVHVRQNMSVSLPPIHSSNVVAIVDVYGEAGRNGNYKDHSEYFLIEYRKREGFNSFAGGPIVQDPNFTGGALVWHYSTIREFDLAGDFVERRLGLKVENFGSGFAGNPGSPSHFYPYRGTVLDQTTNPNSNSTSNLITGISLNGFSFSGGFLNFVVNYQIEQPPDYTMYLYGSLGEPDWNGKVYFQSRAFTTNVRSIAAGTTVDIAVEDYNVRPSPNFTAVGDQQSPIVLRGVGYGNQRIKWPGILLQDYLLNAPPQMRYCTVSDATTGVLIGWTEGTLAPPTIRNCIFSDCVEDIELFGNAIANSFFELAGLDDNSFTTFRAWYNLKLTGAQFNLPANSVLKFGRENFSGYSRLRVTNGDFNVFGNASIEVNTTMEGSQFKFFNDVGIPPGTILTVSELNGPSILSFENGASLVVNGTLRAHGNVQNRVTFTSAGGWSGITIGSSPSTISLNYTNISNAATAINAGHFTTLTVENCNFSNCNIGINIFPTAHSPIPTMQITNSTFSNTPNNGLGISIEGYSDILLAGNSLTGPLYYGGIKGTGISLNASSPRMVGNTVEWFKTGFSCANVSEPMLEDVEGVGNNTFSNNTYAVVCDMSNANLGYDYGGNSICYNSAVDIWIDGGSKVFARNDSWVSPSCDPENPPGTFLIVDGSIDYVPCAGSCGGQNPIVGDTNGKIFEEGDPMMTRLKTLLGVAMLPSTLCVRSARTPKLNHTR